MHPTEFFRFSSRKYKEKISDKDSYGLPYIALNVYRKRRAINTSKVSVVGGVAAAHFTGGSSLVTSVYSARNIGVEKQKLELLEDEWLNRGQSPLDKRPVQDTVIPIFIATASGLFAYTIDLGLSEVVQDAICPFGVPDVELVSEGCSGVKHGAKAVAKAKKKKADEAKKKKADEAKKKKADEAKKKKADERSHRHDEK